MIIEKEYRGPISLEETASVLGVTKEYLSSLFSKETGHPFTWYCNTLRIERSIYYLICSDYTVKHIAGLVGFSSPSYYIKLFKELSGETPVKYRSQSRE